jgi:fatty-acyl-CoA synthase
MGTYVETVLAALSEAGDQDVVVQGERRLGAAAARELILRLAGALAGLGVRAGDGVAVFAGNRPETVLLQVAVHLLGCRLVFLPPEPGPSALAALVELADLRALVVDAEHEERAAGLLARVSVPDVCCLGPSRRFRDLLGAAAAVPAELPAGPLPDDVTTLLYTGGTTGQPKLVVHGGRLYDVIAASAGLLPGPGRPRVLVCPLVTHGAGHLTAIRTLAAGGALVLLPRFDAGAALAALRCERITVVLVVPAMLYELLDHPDCPNRDLPDLAEVTYGASPASPARLAQAVERFGPILHQAYGQTEALGIACLPAWDHDPAQPDVLRSCGHPLPGVEVEIRDERGRPLPDGHVGEVCARGFTQMAGYWRDPERTREVMGDGWVRTGDLGRLGEDGRLYLVDRARDVIVTGLGADNVYSRLLDDFLVTLPGVRGAAAVGVPDERYGEAVHVFVVPDAGQAPDPADLCRRVASELGAIYEPRDVSFVAELPLTPLGKVDKRALRALVSDRSPAPAGSRGSPAAPR